MAIKIVLLQKKASIYIRLNDISTFVVCTEAADSEVSNSKKSKPTEPDTHGQLKSIQRTGKRDGSTDNHVTFDVTEDDDEPDSLEVAPATNTTTKRRGRGKQPTSAAAAAKPRGRPRKDTKNKTSPSDEPPVLPPFGAAQAELEAPSAVGKGKRGRKTKAEAKLSLAGDRAAVNTDKSNSAMRGGDSVASGLNAATTATTDCNDSTPPVAKKATRGRKAKPAAAVEADVKARVEPAAAASANAWRADAVGQSAAANGGAGTGTKGEAGRGASRKAAGGSAGTGTTGRRSITGSANGTVIQRRVTRIKMMVVIRIRKTALAANLRRAGLIQCLRGSHARLLQNCR